MLALILIFTQALSWSAPRKEVEEAKESIKSLIEPLMQGRDKAKPKILKNFRIDGCEKHKVNWMNVLMMKEEVTLNYKFAQGCDIEGSVQPRIFQEFPGNLKLRNLESYDRLQSTNKITGSIEAKPILNLDITNGQLIGKKGAVKFIADYAIQMNPLKGKNPVEKNMGGTITITEIYGEKVTIKEKILVD